MPPVRIKVYGLVTLTRKTYVRIQGFGMVILAGVLAVGASLMILSGEWRPRFPPKDMHALMIFLFWLSLVGGLAAVVETIVVLRMFAKAEARQQAEAAETVLQTQSPTPGQPTRPLENNLHP